MFENIDKFLMLVELFRLFIPEGKNKDIEEFKKWLILHKHDSLVEVLNNQNQLANHLEGLIRDNSGRLEQQLKDINKMLSSIYARTAIFAPVANTLGIYSDLSEQAISILKQFVESGGVQIYINRGLGSPVSYQIDNTGIIKINEQRFVEDDFDTLVKYGLIKQDYGANGNLFYSITRNAENFVKNLPKEDSNE